MGKSFPVGSPHRMDRVNTPQFDRYIGIDYSGAKTAECGLPGLRVYRADGDRVPDEVRPPPGSRRHWTRRGLAFWLGDLLADGVSTIVGVDHAFSFPLRYFDYHGIRRDWDAFLDDFVAHWPTHRPDTSVDHVREGRAGSGGVRGGSSRWRRVCEERTRAKSVFHFDVQGQVAKSSHAGIPWLSVLRRDERVAAHFWPFDGWQPGRATSVVAEVYPALWKHAFPIEGRTGDQHDAFSVAAWLRQSDRDGVLARCLNPALDPGDRDAAAVEGWILGVG